MKENFDNIQWDTIFIKKKLEEIEKNINALFDDMNEIKNKLGLDQRLKIGKRHREDIIYIVDYILKKNTTFPAEGIFAQISPYLLENDNISDTNEIEKWLKQNEQGWLETIEKRREFIKSG